MLSRLFAKRNPSSERVVILGAAGRDFHDFITYWSLLPNVECVAFTGAQIPGIDNRQFPASMCNNDKNGNKYPDGLKIYSETQLEELIAENKVDTCVLAYSDLSYETVGTLGARVNAAGAKFVQLPPQLTMVPSTKPVISVCASRTGVGKSQTTRYLASYFKSKGLRVAAVRHPMPYDKNLESQRCQRYEKMEDMDKYKCTIEEREEYYGHIKEGTLLFAGVDYSMILREAEKDADVIIWDGGNNDLPFFKPDLHICMVDSLRPSDQNHFYPGETNVRLADVVLLSKVNELSGLDKADVLAKKLKPLLQSSTPVLYGRSIITPEARDPDTNELLTKEQAENLIRGKKVLVVEDGPTCTHGGMATGVGYRLAKDLGAAEIVDPRPFAKGSLVGVFKKFPHLRNVLPAMGYGEEQIMDLKNTINAVPCETVILGTPSNMQTVIHVNVPSVVARYDLELVPEHDKKFHDMLDSFLEKQRA